jgi:membrane-bound serine protease (ClpP class)
VRRLAFGVRFVVAMTVLGSVLLVLGATLLVAEAHIASFGALGLAGLTAIVTGVVLALQGAGASLAVALAVAAGAALAGGGYLLLATSKVAAARRSRVRAGSPALIGKVGVVRTWDAPAGQVFVDGALWRALTAWPDDEAVVQRGDRVVIERISGLTLCVRKAEEWEVLS